MRHIIPFFVADRQASLMILKGVLLKYPMIKVGVMTHVFTSRNMWQAFKNFPKGIPLLYEEDIFLKNEDALTNSLVKMTDSGIFSKKGCKIDYTELFDRYNKMETDFGIMIDVLRDSKATLKSAEEALRIYERNRRKYKFKLIAVAQGNDIEEYLECFRKLSNNFEFIAVGGLLKKRENSARYVRVRDEDFLYKVLESIKMEFNPEWLFALGCYHPSRHKKFEEIGIWGSDYKGWIFNYKQKKKMIEELNNDLSEIETKNSICYKLSKLKKKILKLESDLNKEESKWRMAHQNDLKKVSWHKIKKLKIELELANKKLFMERKLISQGDHLPNEYKIKVMSLGKIIYKGEQLLRFQQVRDYIEKKVYAQLQ